MKPSLLLINPWIYDYAAYDLWSKPLGLLSLAGHLRGCGYSIHVLDCLDVHHPLCKQHPSGSGPPRRQYGTGKFRRTKTVPPPVLQSTERPYSRYGISTEAFMQDLRRVTSPSAILVTSLMTYWYPGAMEAIAMAKAVHPGIPLILGGIYARICHDHAVRTSGADHVSSAKTPQEVLRLLETMGIPPGHPEGTPPPAHPAFELLNGMDYICLSTSAGCPYRCSYCASHFLQPGFNRRDPGEVIEEILYWHKGFGVRDFAFYDDALAASNPHLTLLLEGLASLGLPLRFHTPNALHAREITPELGRLLHRTGFRTIRLGLETADFSFRRSLDSKISEGEFERAAENLRNGGFSKREVGAYILLGLPGQSVQSVEETIRLAAACGVNPYLSEYSPIPHTPLWEEAVASSPYPISEEPLFQNNSLVPCWDEGKRRELPRLKRLANEVRRRGES